VPVSGVVEFSNITGLTVTGSGSTNVILVIGHKVMSSGKGVRGVVMSNWVESYGVLTGVTNTSDGEYTGIKKIVPGDIYVSVITQGERWEQRAEAQLIQIGQTVDCI